MPPIDLVLYRRIYCPPVIEVIKEITGIGVEVDPDNLRFCETNSLNQALQSVIQVS